MAVVPAERDLRRVIGDGESIPDGEVEGLSDDDLLELQRPITEGAHDELAELGIGVHAAPLALVDVERDLRLAVARSGEDAPLLRRDAQDDRGAFALAAAQRYRPGMFGDDVVDHGQAQAGAFAGLLGGKEGLEYVVLQLLGNAVAVVAYHHLDEIAVGAPRHLDTVTRMRGVAGVGEQIDEHLNHALPFAPYRRLGRALVEKLDLLAGVRQPHQPHRVVDALAYVEGAEWLIHGGAAVAEAHQGVDDVGDAAGLLQHLFDAVAHEIGGARLGQHILRQAGDAGDRIADLVGDAGGEAADGGEPLAVG